MSNNNMRERSPPTFVHNEQKLMIIFNYTFIAKS